MQLTERRQGNSAYRSSNYAQALQHYERARSIVDLVRGLSRADQAEVDVNRVAVLCNIAAVHLATKDFGAASEICSKALEVDPLCVKALSRRCKAQIGRHEYGAAAADVVKMKELGVEAAEQVAEVEMLLQQSQVADRRSDARTFGSMFDRKK